MNEALEVLEHFILNIKDKEVYSEITKTYESLQKLYKRRYVVFDKKLSKLQRELFNLAK
jgi:hypothetical protein